MALAPVPTLPAYTDELDPFFLQNLKIIYKIKKFKLRTLQRVAVWNTL
jgi:hypothetical protein